MATEKRRKVVFLTGTRADFGKLKPLMLALHQDNAFEVHIFVTGMHMLSKYGYTCLEVERAGFGNIYKYINQNSSDSMDHILSKTISGFSDFVKEIAPDFIIVHGDRVEALAGAIVGSLNNILTGHVEGGEVSGTIDELIRHAVTKLSHIHFVANDTAGARLTQLGESRETIHVIGSPDVDIMTSPSLPTIAEVQHYYDLAFSEYALLIFHPVTSEIEDLYRQIRVVVDDVLESELNYIVIFPNNDPGTDIILEEYNRLKDHPNFKIFPSMRFEYFLTLLKHSRVIVGNSSAAIREAPHFGVPAVNVGSRQHRRVNCNLVINVPAERGQIVRALGIAEKMPRESISIFGDGNSALRFRDIVVSTEFWKHKTQKHFVDRFSG